MKKVIDLLGKRKVAINLQLDQLPREVDQYIAEIAGNLMNELHQIENALEILESSDKIKRNAKHI